MPTCTSILFGILGFVRPGFVRIGLRGLAIGTLVGSLAALSVSGCAASSAGGSSGAAGAGGPPSGGTAGTATGGHGGSKLAGGGAAGTAAGGNGGGLSGGAAGTAPAGVGGVAGGTANGGSAGSGAAGSAGAGSGGTGGNLMASQPLSPNIVVDQFGYRTADEKIAVIRNPQTGIRRARHVHAGRQVRAGRRAQRHEAARGGAGPVERRHDRQLLGRQGLVVRFLDGDHRRRLLRPRRDAERPLGRLQHRRQRLPRRADAGDAHALLSARRLRQDRPVRRRRLGRRRRPHRQVLPLQRHDHDAEPGSARRLVGRGRFQQVHQLGRQRRHRAAARLRRDARRRSPTPPTSPSRATAWPTCSTR